MRLRSPGGRPPPGAEHRDVPAKSPANSGRPTTALQVSITAANTVSGPGRRVRVRRHHEGDDEGDLDHRHRGRRDREPSGSPTRCAITRRGTPRPAPLRPGTPQPGRAPLRPAPYPSRASTTSEASGTTVVHLNRRITSTPLMHPAVSTPPRGLYRSTAASGPLYRNRCGEIGPEHGTDRLNARPRPLARRGERLRTAPPVRTRLRPESTGTGRRAEASAACRRRRARSCRPQCGRGLPASPSRRRSQRSRCRRRRPG